MTLQQAIKILKQHNKWRLGGETPMAKSVILTIAINKIISDYESKTKTNSVETIEA